MVTHGGNRLLVLQKAHDPKLAKYWDILNELAIMNTVSMNQIRELVSELPGTQVEVVPDLKADDGRSLLGFAGLNRRILISEEVTKDPELLREVAIHEIGEDLFHQQNNKISDGDFGANLVRLLQGDEIDESLGNEDYVTVDGVEGEALTLLQAGLGRIGVAAVIAAVGGGILIGNKYKVDGDEWNHFKEIAKDPHKWTEGLQDVGNDGIKNLRGGAKKGRKGFFVFWRNKQNYLNALVKHFGIKKNSDTYKKIRDNSSMKDHKDDDGVRRKRLYLGTVATHTLFNYLNDN
jgi:hypothetical protein